MLKNEFFGNRHLTNRAFFSLKGGVNPVRRIAAGAVISHLLHNVVSVGYCQELFLGMEQALGWRYGVQLKLQASFAFSVGISIWFLAKVKGF